MLEIEKTGLFESDLSKPINLFVGAGFSILAKNQFAETLPVGDTLKNA